MSASRESFQTPFCWRTNEKEAETTVAPESGSNNDTAMGTDGAGDGRIRLCGIYWLKG